MLKITGIELTQAIQYFGSTYPVCGTPSSPRPCDDNMIPLVAGKPTAARIYFEGASPGMAVTGFGVKLETDGSPSNVTFPAGADLINVPTPPQRENSGHSVNLLIPAQSSHNVWTLAVSIFEKPAAGVGQVAAKAVRVSFERRALIPIRVVRMHYKGRGLDVPPPTMADFWLMADYVQRTWPNPLPSFCVVRESVEVYDGAFSHQLDSDDPAEIGTTGTIWDILARLRATEGFTSDVIYFGFYPNPAGARGGAGGGYSFVAPNVIPGLTAHELGHAQGLPHAGWGDFPRYASLPWGCIGEVGFDPREKTAFNGSHYDVMGYDLPRWISPHNYIKLFSAVGVPKPGPCSSLPFPGEIVQPPNRPEFTCYYSERLPGGDFTKTLCGPKITRQFPGIPRPEETPRPIRARLLDERGETIFEDSFELSQLSEPREGFRPRIFAVTVPVLHGAKRLVVSHGDQVIEDSELSSEPVDFKARARTLGGPARRVRVEWTLSRKDAAAPVFVRASSDNGRGWTAFNVPRGSKQIDIDPTALPPGDGCIVEVLAGERLRTTSWVSERLAIRTGRDEVIVLAPQEEIRAPYGEAVELNAVTTYGSGYEEIIWSSDRDGDIGAGGHLVARLSHGKHVLSVRRGACGGRLHGGVVQVSKP